MTTTSSTTLEFLAEAAELTTHEWHTALDWYRAVARNHRAGGRVQDANGIDRICDAGAAGVVDSQQYIVDRWREQPRTASEIDAVTLREAPES